MYIANVGDSTIILGKSNPKFRENSEPEVVAEVITRDHKPEDEKEKRRIEALGGNVLLSKKGVMRVVWERKRQVQAETRTGESYQVDKIPFLGVARSLGDLWSVTKNNEYLVSPVPDVYVHYFDLTKDKFIILASDGLWNMLKPQETVETVHEFYSKDMANEASRVIINIARERWSKRSLTADNTSVLIGFFSQVSMPSYKESDSLQAMDKKLGKRNNQSDCQSISCSKKPC